MYVVWFGKICLFHYHFLSTLYHLYVVLLNLQMVFVLMKNIKLKKPRTGPIPTVKGSLNDLCSLINNLFLIICLKFVKLNIVPYINLWFSGTIVHGFKRH